MRSLWVSERDQNSRKNWSPRSMAMGMAWSIRAGSILRVLSAGVWVASLPRRIWLSRSTSCSQRSWMRYGWPLVRLTILSTAAGV